MSTASTPTLNELASDWDAGMDYSTATLSGIVGDLAHASEGGYHISIEDQVSSTNYSIVRPDDKAPPGNWPRNRASAIDMSMGTADMVKCWNRVFAVWSNRFNDPRAKYINAVNAWNGVGSAERLDFVSGSRTTATADHKWHTHLEIRRRYVNDPEAKRAIASVFRGESIAQYQGGGAMAITDDPHAWRQALRTEGIFKLTNVVDGSVTEVNQLKVMLQSHSNKLDELLGRPVQGTITLTAEQLQEFTDAVGEQVSAAVVAADNSLTEDDLPAIKEQVKAALREGTGVI